MKAFRVGGIAAAVVVLSGSIGFAQKTETVATTSQGIQPLTADTLARAVAEGQKDKPDASAFMPLADFVQVNTMQKIVRDRDLHLRFESYENAPFSPEIESPYVAALLAASEAKRKYEPTPTLDPSTLNAQKVVVHVDPGSQLSTVDVIQNVIIKRNDQIIRPLKQKIVPTTVSNAMGASRPAATGDFTFDFDTFAPTDSITLVFVGAKGNWEWVMSPQELALLK